VETEATEEEVGMAEMVAEEATVLRAIQEQMPILQVLTAALVVQEVILFLMRTNIGSRE